MSTILFCTTLPYSTLAFTILLGIRQQYSSELYCRVLCLYACSATTTVLLRTLLSFTALTYDYAYDNIALQKYTSMGDVLRAVWVCVYCSAGM
jgi:hypothetical protein